MIEIDSFKLLDIIQFASTGLSFIVSIWLCLRFRFWGALLASLFV